MASSTIEPVFSERLSRIKCFPPCNISQQFDLEFPLRPMLQTIDLTKSYKGRIVVDDVCLEVQRGEVVALLGPNGAGKTTTFYIMVGLTPPDAGRILLDGADLTRMQMYQRARQGIGYLPQG